MDAPLNGARLSYAQVSLGGVNRVHEVHQPEIHLAASPGELSNMILIDPQGADPFRPIVLARGQGATQAYALTHVPEHAINLYRRGTNRPPNWGKLYFGVAYPAVENTPNVFQATIVPQEVAIKRLNKFAVRDYLQQHPHGENPIKELARMELLGDNEHVLRHIEALQDEKYLYIVMPKGLGTLEKVINWHQKYTDQVREIMPPSRCHDIFCKIIKIMCHLLRHGINHHDISPDNFLFLSYDNLVLFDFALSNRIPINPNNGHRTLIAPPLIDENGNRTVYGTTAWMDAVVYGGNQPYDGVAMDLYAAAMILYNMTTNESLYRIPSVNDADYNHFIHLEGLWLRNQQTVDNLHDVGFHHRMNQNLPTGSILNRLYKLSTLHCDVNPQVMSLLTIMLNENPALRASLADVMDSDYVQVFQD